jgi:hypothetical protein
MTSPSIKTTKVYDGLDDKTEKISSFSKCDKKMCFGYAVAVFILLLICRPSFIMKKVGLLEKEQTISYSKLIIWEIVLCFPLFFYYVINY